MFNKRGQLTIFILIGIFVILIGLISIYFYNPSILGFGGPTVDKNTFEFCVKDSIDNLIVDLSMTGGFTGAYFNKSYMGVSVPYVCYSDEYYKPCVVQTPFLEEVFKESFKDSIDGEIQKCYNKFVEDFKRQGYSVVEGEVEITADILPEIIRLKIDAPLSVSDGESSSGYDSFTIELPTKIYSILMLANAIVGYEISYGTFDLIQSQLYYPDTLVNAFKPGDGTTVYVINYGEINYQFAVRSYVFPPGYGG
jgi:hypothetical protein